MASPEIAAKALQAAKAMDFLADQIRDNLIDDAGTIAAIAALAGFANAAAEELSE